jgi:hypothetical protein
MFNFGPLKVRLHYWRGSGPVTTISPSELTTEKAIRVDDKYRVSAGMGARLYGFVTKDGFISLNGFVVSVVKDVAT